jgi:hypothetical protein
LFGGRSEVTERNFFFNKSGDFAVKKYHLAGKRMVALTKAAGAVLVEGTGAA